MRRKKITLGIIACCSAFSFLPVFAQEQENEIPKSSHFMDVAGGAGAGIFSGSFSWNRTHGINKSNKIRLGYGLRFSGFGGSNLTYTTAPAQLIMDKEIDTLQLNSAMTMGLSAVINIQYAFSPKLTAGFNIDAIGMGFGPVQNGTFVSTPDPGNLNKEQQASPTALNVLLIGNNDIGQIKSEFYLAYYISEKTLLRGGLDFTYSEYTSSEKLTHNNDRFRYQAILFFLGFSFNPF